MTLTAKVVEHLLWMTLGLLAGVAALIASVCGTDQTQGR